MVSALKVSVVVPTYNQAKYLRPCLDSIWFQNYPEIEIIVVNDGATDDTSDVLKEFLNDLKTAEVSYLSFYDRSSETLVRKYYPRYFKEGRTFRIIDLKNNKGLPRALNEGIRAATGEYCTYVPSDNLCYPHMMEELARALKEEDADFAYGDMLIFDDSGNIIRPFQLPDYEFKECFESWYLCGQAKLYKLSLHEKNGYYDETLLAHDHELFQRFAMGGAKFIHVPKFLFGVRDHDGDRNIDIHSSKNWNRLINESKGIVKQAREWNKVNHGIQ